MARPAPPPCPDGDPAAAQARAEERGPEARIKAAAPYALALALFALGASALQHLLAPVDIHAVADQIRGTSAGVIAAALAATFTGYLCLAAYDWSALRHIGKPLPLPVALSGGFLAYAFGNTVGLNAVSGGAVRWRLYSGLGLDGYDIAAVSTFASIAFGAAATLVGLGALALHPTALGSLLPLPPETMRIAAAAGFVATLAPLLWACARRKRVALGRFSLEAPGPGLAAAQLAISLGDVAFSALTLYVLLPAGGPDFPTFLAIFAAATMAGVISHVPGGVGVFETVVIAAFPGSVPVEEIAAALLLFRLIYYLVPFAAALTLMSGFEAWRALGGRARSGAMGAVFAAVAPAFRAIAPAAPFLLSVMVFGSGLWMSLGALLPPVSRGAELAEDVFPLAILEGSALLSSALGALLIVLSLGLARRSAGALWLTFAAMLAAGVLSALQPGEAEQAATLALGVLLLWPFRRAFRRRSVLTHAALSPAWGALLLAGAASLGFVLFFAHKSTPYAHEMWWEFARDASAPRAWRAGLVASLTLGAGALLLLLRAPRFRPARPDAAALETAAAIAAADGAPETALALMGDKALLFSDDRRGVVAFGVSGGSWIACGGPAGPADAAEEAGFDFVEEARRAGARPVFHEVGAQDVPLMLDLGLSLHKTAEEAVIALPGFTLEGRGRRRLRTAHARARRAGLRMTLHMPPHSAALLDEARAVSDDWLDAEGLRETGFASGRFDPAWLNRWPLAAVRREGRLVGIALALQAGPGGAARADLLRHTGDAPPETTAFLLAELAAHLRDAGAPALSLGMAPAAGPKAGGGRHAPRQRLRERFGALLHRHDPEETDFDRQRALRELFEPEWRPRWLAAQSGSSSFLPLEDAARLIAAPPARGRRRR